MKTIEAVVVVSHPDSGSFNHAIADAVAETWRESGAMVSLRDLHAEGFDPLLTAEEHRGHATSDPLVRDHIEMLRRCALLAVVHPNCWGAPPAMMKGWIDRVFAPGAAYAFEKGVDAGDTPVGLLTVKAALVLNTGNTAGERERDHFGDPLERIWRDCVLSYCGVGTIHRALFGVVATSTSARREHWLATARELAREAMANASHSD